MIKGKGCVGVGCCRDRAMRVRASRYGVNKDEFEGLYADQGGRCLICGVAGPIDGKTGLAMDHCKRTGDLRGFLCHTCNNQIMNKVDEDPGWFLRASVYKDTSRFEVSGVFDGNSHKEKNAYALFNKFRINKAEHEALYKKQSGRCALCYKKKPKHGFDCLHIDHCHDDGHIRGLLCMRCNRNLMPVIDKRKHLVFRAFKYKARKTFKRTVWKQSKLTKLALAKKGRCVVRWSKTNLIELVVLLSGRYMSEREIAKALVEVDGHDYDKKVTGLLNRVVGRERSQIEKIYTDTPQPLFADKSVAQSC